MAATGTAVPGRGASLAVIAVVTRPQSGWFAMRPQSQAPDSRPSAIGSLHYKALFATIHTEVSTLGLRVLIHVAEGAEGASVQDAEEERA